ncbi:hypothetical protein L917_21483 [Phytophthora nicotianae]|uniref:Uncharacterized protein n=1 Tax=Phytophthora nicotianae TaxID=4792 RepID=W2JXF5_PHYNI|nr:hypothetical protein L917_21483 [Phytophthora nicotianae]
MGRLLVLCLKMAKAATPSSQHRLQINRTSQSQSGTNRSQSGTNRSQSGTNQDKSGLNRAQSGMQK